MLHVCDVLTAKQSFMREINCGFTGRKFQILEIHSLNKDTFHACLLKLDTKGQYNGQFKYTDFYFSNRLNDDIQNLINKEEIVSFNAVTADGKVINLELIK